MNITPIIVLFILLGWVCYQIQKRIGEEQAREWKDFVAVNPNLDGKHTSGATSDEQKKVHRRNVGPLGPISP